MYAKSREFARKAIVAAVFCVLLFGPNANAEVSVGQQRIAITGPIDKQTVEEFRNALSDGRIASLAQGLPFFVALDSPGGSVTDAMLVGKMIRQANLMTGVFEGAQCSSACVLILAAGVKRIATYGKIGIHRPRFDEALFASLTPELARAKYDEMANSVRQYLVQMGVSDNLYIAMLKVPSNHIELLLVARIREFGLEGEDPSWAEYQIAKAVTRVGRRQFEFYQSLGRVNATCWNRFGLNADRCALDKKQYEDETRGCSSTTEEDYIGCVRAVERRITGKYR